MVEHSVHVGAVVDRQHIEKKKIFPRDGIGQSSGRGWDVSLGQNPKSITDLSFLGTISIVLPFFD